MADIEKPDLGIPEFDAQAAERASRFIIDWANWRISQGVQPELAAISAICNLLGLNEWNGDQDIHMIACMYSESPGQKPQFLEFCRHQK
jgi:hypothetical protein